MEKGDSGDDVRRLLHSIERKSLAVACVLIIGSLMYRSVFISLGVILGAAISLLNFRLLWKIAEPVFRTGAMPRGKFALRFVVKMVGLLAAIFLVVYMDIVNILGFLVGLTTVVLGIVIEGIAHLYCSPRSEA